MPKMKPDLTAPNEEDVEDDFGDFTHEPADSCEEFWNGDGNVEAALEPAYENGFRAALEDGREPGTTPNPYKGSCDKADAVLWAQGYAAGSAP
jgi:hypothetical protein